MLDRYISRRPFMAFHIARFFHLQPGSQVGIATEGGRLVVEPRQRRRYTLEELLAQCDSKAPRAREEREWLSSKPAGGEIVNAARSGSSVSIPRRDTSRRAAVRC
jgi:antitoxin ChpS